MITKLGIGVIGLGRAFRLMARGFALDPRVELVAGADPDPEARQAFNGKAFASAEDLCAAPGVDVVYVATPHPLHAEHARIAFAAKKHVLVEKPMALTAAECRAMVDGARKAGVVLMVGHSHSYDLPILHTKRLLEVYGPLRMITAVNFTDFLRRRKRDPVDTVVHNQAAHQVDIARLLAASRVVSVRASIHEGAYSCRLGFESGASALLAYNGEGRFRSDHLMNGIPETGQPGVAHEHFGLVIVACDKADLRPLPTGVMVYGDGEPRFEALPPPAIPRKEVIDELYAAVVEGKPPLHGGEWGAATMDVVFAMASA